MTTMLSRIADNLFWLHRYMERADGLILTLRSTYILSFDKDLYGTYGYRPILQTFTALSSEDMDDLEANIPDLLKYVVCDGRNINSMKALVGKARENARGSQDKITKELWEQVNAMFHYLQHSEMPKRLSEPFALDTFDYIQQQCLLYNGVVDSTMPRGLGWCFMNIGKYIERCLQTINLTDNYFIPINHQPDGTEDLLYWRRLLLSLSGYELYLKTNRSTAHSRQVLFQTIMDNYFPRSVLYSLKRIDKYLVDIIGDNPGKEVQALQKQFGRLLSTVLYTDIYQLNKETLPVFLHEIRKQTCDFSANLSKIFFSYT